MRISDWSSDVCSSDLYKQSGGVSTYKVDVDWTVTDGVRLRGGYQRAIRAPNVGELYTATTGLYPTIGLIANGGGDPCDIRSSFRTGSNGADVRDICVAQGMPDRKSTRLNSSH